MKKDVSQQEPTQADATDAFAEDEDLEARLAFEKLRTQRAKRKRRRIVVIALVALVAVVAAVIFFMNGAQQGDSDEMALDPMSITTMVEAGDFATSISANGATEPLSSTVVTPEVEGIIEDLNVEVGNQVYEGQVLFTVKNAKLDTAVRDAQTTLDGARRTRERALASIDKANRDVDQAYKDRLDAWERARLADDWETYDERSLNAAVSSAEDALDSAYDTYTDADSAVDKAYLALLDAESDANKRTVRAPVSGTIISMSAKEGANTMGGAGDGQSSEPLMQIVDLSQMKVTVQVNESDISLIKLGQAAKATFSALPDVELDAWVTRIASTATGSGSATGGSGSGVVTYAVDLLIPEPTEELRPGMTAKVTVTIESIPNTLTVTSAAVAEDADGSYVIVVDDADAGLTHRADVEVIAQNSSETAVSGDVKAGDVVLLDPLSLSGEGDAGEMGEVEGYEDEGTGEMS